MAEEFVLEKLFEGARGLGPLLTFRWVCRKLPFGMDVNFVESISLPFPTIDVGDPLYGGGTFFHFPTFVRVDSFNMTLFENTECETLQWLMAWMDKIRNFKEGWYNLPKVYKQDIEVELFDDQEKVVAKAKLIGCWPTQIANLDLNYTESNRAIINVTMSVDMVEYSS